MGITKFGISAVIGFLVAGYLLWHNSKVENLSEDETLDIFLASTAWALVAARTATIILQFDRFGWDLTRWLSLFYLPGLNGFAALIVGMLMVAIGIRRREWNIWLGLDVFAPAILIWQAVLVLLYQWQLTIFWGIWSILLIFIFHQYRHWEFYRGRRGEAKPGLTAALWIIATGSGLILLALLNPSVIFFSYSGFGLVAAGSVVAYVRSGRIIQNDVQYFRQTAKGSIKIITGIKRKSR